VRPRSTRGVTASGPVESPLATATTGPLTAGTSWPRPRVSWFRRVRDLERARDQGQVRRSGQRWTVAEWLDHWLENIARPNIRETSYSAYRVAVRRHLIPGLGQQRLDRLEPEHLEGLYRKIVADGGRPGRAHQVHRTIRTALGEAHRRGHVARNVAALTRPPRVQVDPVEPYNVDEVRSILTAAGRHAGIPMVPVGRSRWRSGYARARCWDWPGQTSTWTPVLFAFARRVTARHTSTAVTGPAEKRRAGAPSALSRTEWRGTPSRTLAGGWWVFRRRWSNCFRHRAEQEQWRASARQLWQDGGWVFTSLVGAAHPDSDYHRWKALLKEAGVRDGRLHDARHTVATVLLVLAVPERTVMGIMGWSSTAMAARYQHVTDPIRRKVADQVGGLLWAGERTGPDDN